MASKAHSATVRTVHCAPPFRNDTSCGLCGANMIAGSITLPFGKVVSVTAGDLRLNAFVHLDCDQSFVFHEKCIEQWFLKGKTCPIHPCEVTLESRFVEQVPLDSKSSEDPSAQTRHRSHSAAQAQLDRSDLYNSSDSESSGDLYS